VHCGDSPAALETRKHNGISVYCFRCGETEWTPMEPVLRHYEEPPRDRPPPPDMGDPWPPEAVAWLARLGFGRWERESVLKAYWSERVRRIIFPMNDGYWTGRALDEGRPKWLSALRGRDTCVQEYTADGHEYPRSAVVLTEDLLSAAKVGLSSPLVTAVPCLGTLPSPSVLARAAEAPRVIWWLDPDGAGQRMAVKGHQKLLALGVRSRIMPTHLVDQDPKYLNPEEIQRRIASLILT
jgi:hypothetical protein